MLRSAALYIALVISLVIAFMCSALIMLSAYYKDLGQRAARSAILHSNLSSAVNILLAGSDTSYTTRRLSLFGTGNDTACLKRICWGLYDVGIVTAISQNDSLTNVLSLGKEIDSTKWAALYLTDNQRPLGISGKAVITGPMFISPSGLTKININGQGFPSKDAVLNNKRQPSGRELPALNSTRLSNIHSLLSQVSKADKSITISSETRSFTYPLMIDVIKKTDTLKSKKLSGHILLLSDSALVIDSSTVLDNVIIYAKSITVKNGFHGICQMFAQDSINIGKRCLFDYPSAIGVVRFEPAGGNIPQAKVTIQSGSIINGLVFSYEIKSAIPSLIRLEDHSIVNGQIYCKGALELKSYSEVFGAVITNNLIYRTSFTNYDNVLVNVIINSDRLSSQYLTSDLLPMASTTNRILQWLK